MLRRLAVSVVLAASPALAEGVGSARVEGGVSITHGKPAGPVRCPDGSVMKGGSCPGDLMVVFPKVVGCLPVEHPDPNGRTTYSIDCARAKMVGGSSPSGSFSMDANGNVTYTPR